MSRTTRRRLLREAHTELGKIHKLLPQFEDTIADEILDGGGRGDACGRRAKGAVNDPTGSLALRDHRAKADEREATRHLQHIASTVEKLGKVVRYHTEQIPLTDRELAELERQSDPGCEAMARVKVRHGKKVKAAFDETYQVSDVGGRLERDHRLGRWAYDFVLKHDRLPTVDECRMHQRGIRVMVKAKVR